MRGTVHDQNIELQRRYSETNFCRMQMSASTLEDNIFYLLRHLMEQQTFHIERFDLLSKLNMTFQKLHFFIRPHLSIVRPYWDGQEQGR